MIWIKVCQVKKRGESLLAARLRLRQERLKLPHHRPAVKLHDSLVVVLTPPLEAVVVVVEVLVEVLVMQYVK